MASSRKLIYILWPSFLVAALAVGVFFTMVDPSDLHLFGTPIEASDVGVYTLGFFVFWAFAAASSALTCFLMRGAGEINAVDPMAQATERPSAYPPGAGPDNGP